MIKIIKNNQLFLLIISFCLSAYFLGFYVREISNGAGHTDFQYHIWLLINDFDKNFSDTLKNYLSYKEATFPFYHIIQSFLNPFKFHYLSFCLSNTIFNLTILVIFFYFIKKKNIYDKKNLNNNFLIIFILLLSPWFRSSSYWGMTENFSIFFLIPSLFYLSNLFEKRINNYENLILTVFICLTIYSRQQFIFLPFSHLLILFIDKNYKKLFQSTIIYFVFSLPGLYVYNLWGVFGNLDNATSASDYISLKNIYLNIPKISTLFLFYLIPIIILNFEKFYQTLLKKKSFITFILIFIIQYFLFKDINYSNFGGGYFIKFNNLFFDNNMLFPIILSSLFFLILISFQNILNYRYYVLLFFIFIVIGLPKYLYQEWFDPIYIFFYFILLPKNLILTSKLNSLKSIYLLITWETLILIIAIIYYHGVLKIPFFYSF